MMVILTVETKNGRTIRDTHHIENTMVLIHAVNAWIMEGCTIIALEGFDSTIEEFYSRALTDDDIDAMAAAQGPE